MLPCNSPITEITVDSFNTFLDSLALDDKSPLLCDKPSTTVASWHGSTNNPENRVTHIMHQHLLFANKIGVEVSDGQVVGAVRAIGFW